MSSTTSAYQEKIDFLANQIPYFGNISDTSICGLSPHFDCDDPGLQTFSDEQQQARTGEPETLVSNTSSEDSMDVEWDRLLVASATRASE
jgi:hypothetical protein